MWLYLLQLTARLEVFLGFRLRHSILALVLALLPGVCLAQNTPKVSLDTSETLFTILAAMNACGYDAELNLSDPVRKQIRGELGRAAHDSDDALETTNVMCQYYHEHVRPDPSRDLAQYISLALYLGDPPNLLPKVKEAELPPDAANVVPFAKLAAAFYERAGLHAIWQKHREAYARLADRYHEPLSKTLFDTEIYLKLPSAGYLGRGFTVYLEPMGAPGQVNARNYGNEYYVVISPAGSELKMDQIRHTYLHYLLDPLSLKYPASIKRLDPLLESVKRAPMEEAFKIDTSLLVTECLVRAVEIRTQGNSKTPEALRSDAVEKSMEQGYILTRYFYDALIQFEKNPEGIRNAYIDLLSNVDLKKEEKRAAEIQFASNASPEVLRFSRPKDQHLLLLAEKRMSGGDLKTAQDLAEQALRNGQEDPGRALFVLAQIAAANKDMAGATGYFERALKVAQEPKVVAWSHIYLGRIFDLQEQRENALNQYHAALSTGGTLPEVKAAAERGLQQPYEPPAPR
jgi:tetratricopeptide (TPR) repeat protein